MKSWKSNLDKTARRAGALGAAFAATALAITWAAAGSAARPEKSTGESVFLKNARQLTYEGRRAGEGYFSPDDKRFVFPSERDPDNPFYQIFVMRFEDGETRRVSPGVGKTTCPYFRPGTDALLYSSTHLDPDAAQKQKDELDFRASGQQRRYTWDYDEFYDVFTSKSDGTSRVRLTDARGYDAEASYSPDGSKIVYCSMRDAYPEEHLSEKDRKRLEFNPAYFGEIYIMNADGSGQTRLTDWPGYDGGPFFSPDGTRIIWRHFQTDGMIADVYTMRLDGSDRRRLTDFGAMSWAPYYHPSGKYVIFTSNKLGFSNFELYLVDAAGLKEPVRVTYTDGFDGLPIFDAFGTRLSWTTNRTPDGKTQIYIADWDHQAALDMLTRSPGRKVASNSSDGEAKAFGDGHAPFFNEDESSHGAPNKAADHSPDISADALRADVSVLAADKMEGRLTGSKGEQMAGDYIAGRLSAAGLKPLGENGSYFQAFPFTSGVELDTEHNALALTLPGAEEARAYRVDEDFRPLAFSENGDFEGDLVFAGYGLRLPGEREDAYDSYAGLDVKDKVVLVLRYIPEDVSMERRQALNMYAGLHYKAMLAREHGAKGLLVVTGPNSPDPGELVSLKLDRGVSSCGIGVASVSGDVARGIFEAAGKDLAGVQSGLDVENPHVEGAFALAGVRASMKTTIVRQKKSGRNVVAYLPAPGASADGAGGTYVMMGAHYDHIGHGDIGSLAHKGEEGQIHNGADDNASGTATVLELAEALAADFRDHPGKYKTGFVFALWSGEELGILGSNYFAQHPPIPLEAIAAYFNFDMVGRLRDNSLVLQAAGSSSLWPKLIEKKNVVAGFGLKIQDDPYLPTDVTAFYPKNIPVLSFFTGSHEEYNRPADDTETLNYKGMERIAKFARLMVADVAQSDERPDYVRVEKKKGGGKERASLRAYLGTIPDYAADDVEGVKLSGVRAGGPADKAGLQGGDVIVEFAGQKINNIYDYTYALGAIKIGKPVEVVVKRGEERVTLTVTPESRK